MKDMSSLLVQCLTDQMQTFPFHNLSLLTEQPASVGGTCFDQALKLKETIKRMGLKAHLHEVEVCMTGQKTHRIVQVTNEGYRYFLDAGSGWPTTYIIEPLKSSVVHQEEEHRITGVRFQTFVDQNQALIKRFDGGSWKSMNRISFALQNEEDILAKYGNRYDQPLPFSSELRLCWLNQSRFYRVAGNLLSIFEAGKGVQRHTVQPQELLQIVSQSSFPELVADLKHYYGESL